MPVNSKDGLYAFGSLETVEIPAAGPGYAADSNAKSPVGVLYRHQGNVYKYVKYFDTGLMSPSYDYAGKGEPVYWHALDPVNGVFEVSSDPADIAGLNGFAGVGCEPTASVTHGKYFWMQVGGVALVNFVAPPSPGDKMIGSVTEYQAEFTAAGVDLPDQIFGVVISTIDVDGLFHVLLQNLIW